MFVVIIVVTPSLLISKAFSLEPVTAYTESEKEADECNAAKNAKSQSLAFRLDLRCHREQRT